MVKNRLLEIRLENNKDKLTLDSLFNIANKLNMEITDIVYYEEDPQA